MPWVATMDPSRSSRVRSPPRQSTGFQWSWLGRPASCAPCCPPTTPPGSSGSPRPMTPLPWTKGGWPAGPAPPPAWPPPAGWPPKASWRRPRSSVAVACQLVRRGQAGAVVSAGSTGGIVATARLRLRSVPGLIRPALTVVLPTRPNPTFLVDAGAIADPKPEMLLQFAQLGVAYAQIAHGIDEPRVGLLTIGAEPGKGNRLTRRTYELLSAAPPHGALPIRFAGNVEGSDLMAGTVDVIVTDGFTGNVALKTLEGAAGFAAEQLRAVIEGSRTARLGALLQRRGLRELAGRMDAESYGGAALLGLEGTVVIAHGASTARGITSACLLAADLARGQITEKIRERLGPGRGAHFLRRT